MDLKPILTSARWEVKRATRFLFTWWPVILFTVALAAISCGLVYEPGGKVLQ